MAQAKGSYDPTTLDLNRVIAYARRVARETRAPQRPAIHGKQSGTSQDGGSSVELFGAHWGLLDAISNGETFDSPRLLAEWQARKHWILTPTGELYFVFYEEEFAAHGGARGSWKVSSTVRPMTTHDILEMDYDHPQRSTGRPRTKEEHSWGNLNPGRLQAHAAGVGMSLALKRLLDGS